MKKGNSKTHFGSDIDGTTRERPSCQRRPFRFRMLHRIDGNREISSRTVNCQLYQIKEPNSFFLYRFQANSAAKQTQAHCIYLLLYGEFFRRENRRACAHFPTFFGVNVSTRVFYEFSMCKIFLPLMLPF